MKFVLRIVGIIFAAIGILLLAAGMSAATDFLGIVVLLAMGGLPLALGAFLIWKSMGTTNKKASPPASELPDVNLDIKETSAANTGANDPLQPSVPPMPEPEKPSYKKYAFKVAGISRRQKEITNTLLLENDDYNMSKSELIEIGLVGEYIYKYSPIVLNSELIPEPTNPRDPNAIKVLVDNVHIGYVPADKTGKVKNLLDLKQVLSISCEFYGGPYKIVKESYDYEKEKEIYAVEKESNYYIGAEVTIKYQ